MRLIFVAEPPAKLRYRTWLSTGQDDASLAMPDKRYVAESEAENYITLIIQVGSNRIGVVWAAFLE